jgi:DNA-binding CsgD family transcriptional regulator
VRGADMAGLYDGSTPMIGRGPKDRQGAAMRENLDFSRMTSSLRSQGQRDSFLLGCDPDSGTPVGAMSNPFSEGADSKGGGDEAGTGTARNLPQVGRYHRIDEIDPRVWSKPLALFAETRMTGWSQEKSLALARHFHHVYVIAGGDQNYHNRLMQVRIEPHAPVNDPGAGPCRLGSVRDRSFLEKVVIPAYQEVELRAQPTLHRIHTTIGSRFLVYSRLALPVTDRDGTPCLATFSRTDLVVDLPSSGDEPLNARENACLTLAGSGLVTKQIAHEIGLTRRAVEFHLANARRKLGARNLQHAIALSMTRIMMSEMR